MQKLEKIERKLDTSQKLKTQILLRKQQESKQRNAKEQCRSGLVRESQERKEKRRLQELLLHAQKVRKHMKKWKAAVKLDWEIEMEAREKKQARIDRNKLLVAVEGQKEQRRHQEKIVSEDLRMSKFKEEQRVDNTIKTEKRLLKT